jgi:peptidoglycan LD-endopeptidase CwlK
MSVYGASRLAGCDDRLVQLFTRVGERRDVQIVQGPRTVEEEVAAIASHHSELKNPYNSLHVVGPNRPLALAVDAGPWPLNWTDPASFIAFAVVVKSCALDLGISLVWGGDWQSFKDYSHYQLV